MAFRYKMTFIDEVVEPVEPAGVRAKSCPPVLTLELRRIWGFPIWESEMNQKRVVSKKQMMMNDDE